MEIYIYFFSKHSSWCKRMDINLWSWCPSCLDVISALICGSVTLSPVDSDMKRQLLQTHSIYVEHSAPSGPQIQVKYRLRHVELWSSWQKQVVLMCSRGECWYWETEQLGEAPCHTATSYVCMCVCVCVCVCGGGVWRDGQWRPWESRFPWPA